MVSASVALLFAGVASVNHDGTATVAEFESVPLAVAESVPVIV